jgi:hypothetical protein
LGENVVLTRYERVKLATEYLIAHGILPTPNGWDEATLLKAVQENSWR